MGRQSIPQKKQKITSPEVGPKKHQKDKPGLPEMGMRRGRDQATQCLAVSMSLWPASLSLVVPSTQSSLSVFDTEEPYGGTSHLHKADSTVVSASASLLVPSQRSLDCYSRTPLPFQNSKSEALQGPIVKALMTEEARDKLKRNRNTHARDPESPSTYKVGIVTPLPNKAQRGSCQDPSSQGLTGGISQVWVSTLI